MDGSTNNDINQMYFILLAIYLCLFFFYFVQFNWIFGLFVFDFTVQNSLRFCYFSRFTAPLGIL